MKSLSKFYYYLVFSFLTFLLSTTTVNSQCPPSFILPSPMNTVGDVNNDGFDDLIFFGPDTMAYLISGENLDTLYTIDGTSQGPRWGRGNGQNYAGDVNNDGYDDVLIPEPSRWNAGDTVVGLVYVHSGVDGSLLYTFEGETVGDFYGSQCVGIGDANNDGFDDICVSAYQNASGKIYVYSGQTGDTLFTIEAEPTETYVGFIVAAVGDINNDSLDDILVGSIYGGLEGRAYVYSGAGQLLRTFKAEENHGLFSFGLGGRSGRSEAFDFNGDGFDDMLVAAECWPGGEPCHGRVYLFLGDASQTNQIVLARDAYQIVTGIEERLGQSNELCGAGDVNMDGYHDIAIGGTLGISIFFGGPGPITQKVQPVDADLIISGYGRKVKSAGDINGDGFQDLIVDDTNVFYINMMVDPDGDGLGNACDNCPDTFGLDQTDSDGDGFGDICDLCPGFDDNLDIDSDGIPDDCDNCTCILPGDFNDTGDLNIVDLTTTVNWMFKGGGAPFCLNVADVNGSCSVDVADLTYRVSYMFKSGADLVCGCAE